MKKKIVDNLISAVVVLVVLGGVIFGVINVVSLRLTEEKLNACQKDYPWWEMIKEECGYDEERDNKNDYCRGFRNGYDYRAGQEKIDESILKYESSL